VDRNGDLSNITEDISREMDASKNLEISTPKSNHSYHKSNKMKSKRIQEILVDEHQREVIVKKIIDIIDKSSENKQTKKKRESVNESI
jgi:hypothetical protein